jgi:hypothetical protein
VPDDGEIAVRNVPAPGATLAVRGFWGDFLPLDVTMSTSMMFELFECE